ncbi:hypothetical protein RvY_04048-2 [Ramazzottius varieornatus]|nr:hypothetical protein RvY_04048-2 [Ramazzottius varieornatus]
MNLVDVTAVAALESKLGLKDAEITRLNDVVRTSTLHSSRTERSAQLEVIKQRRMAQLYREVLDIVMSGLPVTSHRDVERMLTDAIWDETTGAWILPPLQLAMTLEVDLRLPPLKLKDQRSRDQGDKKGTSQSPFTFDPHPQLEPLHLIGSPRPLSTARSTMLSSHQRRTPRPPPSVRKKEPLI